MLYSVVAAVCAGFDLVLQVGDKASGVTALRYGNDDSDENTDKEAEVEHGVVGVEDFGCHRANDQEAEAVAEGSYTALEGANPDYGAEG